VGVSEEGAISSNEEQEEEEKEIDSSKRPLRRRLSYLSD
jgi:hypothetical protein